jgi:hypothetical protein
LLVSLVSHSVLESASDPDSKGNIPAAPTGTITRNNGTAGNLVVTLSAVNTTSHSTKVTFPVTTVTIPDGQSSAVFALNTVDDGNLVDGNQVVTISAAAAGYVSGSDSLTVLDKDVPTLGLSLDGQTVAENAGNAAATATLTRNTDPSVPLTISLQSDTVSQVQVPATVTFQPGQSSVTFAVGTVDDGVIDPTRQVNILATAAGFRSGSASLNVTDADTPTLILGFASSTVSEGAAPPATVGTVTRSLVNGNALVINLQSSDASSLLVPDTVTIPANQASVTFPVIAPDDGIVNPTKNITVTAEAQDSTGSPVVTTAVSANVAILDSDGPTLQLFLNTPTLSNAGLGVATVTRNTSTATALTVSLASSDVNNVTVPNTVTIPAGQASMSFPITGMSGTIAGGSEVVTLTASADSFSSGIGTLTVTNANLPDLAASAVTVPATGLVGGTATVSWTVTNVGLASATGSWTDRVYLSTDQQLSGDDQELASATFTGPLGVGQTYTLSRQVTLPQATGTYWILVATDADNVLTEESKFNNVSASTNALTIAPAYLVTVVSDVHLAVNGTAIPLHGSAHDPATGAPVPLVPVAVRVVVNGMQRTLTATTDANGNYQATFQPLPLEVGHYSVFADQPGVTGSSAQDRFTLVGMTANPTQVALNIAPGTPLSGQVEIDNLGDVSLTGLLVSVSGAPSNLAVQASIPPTLAGSGKVQLAYTLTAADASVQHAHVTLHLTSNEGVTLDVPLAVTVVPLAPQLVANPGFLNYGMLVGDQTLVSFTVTNTGGAPSGDLQINLPDVPWLSVEGDTTIPSLAPGANSVVTLALRPDSSLPLELYTGSIVLQGAETAANVSVPFQFRAISAAVGDMQVTADDDYTFYVAGAQGRRRHRHATGSLRQFHCRCPRNDRRQRSGNVPQYSGGNVCAGRNGEPA